MPTVTQHPDRPNIWHLNLTSAERGRLVALNQVSGNLMASSVSETLGLGKFVPVDTDESGEPVEDTLWRTSHRNAEAEFAVLADALEYLLKPGNVADMRLIADQITASRDDPETVPGLSMDEIAVRFNAAR